MTVDPAALDGPPVELDALRGGMRTGDLLLCSGDELFSKVIRAVTRTPWSHVALVLRADSLDKVMVLECVEKIGVRAVPIDRFVTEDSARHTPYPGRILLARHRRFEAQATPERLHAMIDFAVDRFGAPFNPAEMTKIGLRIAFGAVGVAPPKPLRADDEYICSEYVDACLQKVDIQTPWNRKGFIAPSDFAADPQVEAIARVATR